MTPEEEEQFRQAMAFPNMTTSDASAERVERLTAKYAAMLNSEQGRKDRRDAVELAVKALTPIIAAFSGDAIGRAIIELATEPGAYIRNGG